MIPVKKHGFGILLGDFCFHAYIYIYDHFFIADITVRLIYIFLSSASKWVAESSIETSQPRWFAGFWGDEILPSSIRIITDAIF